MIKLLTKLLNKIDYRLTSCAFSRPQYQVELISESLKRFRKIKFRKLLDIGGGFDARYRHLLESVSEKYINLEIANGPNVDVVGSVYKLPKKLSGCDLITMFMVLEHLNEPLAALKECNKILRRNGYLALTTVQYWHTHSYPSDYYRYTKYGLKYLFREAGFKVVKIWSMGGPFLVIFHAIELNIPNSLRTIYSICFYRLMDWLDWIFFKHEDKRKPNNDSVGWSLIAKKL